MSTKYKSYIEYLTSFAESNSFAVEAETNVYPLFQDLERLINYYKSTIAKFPNIQKEMVEFIERLDFNDDHFEYYQDKFKGLIQLDEYLVELRNKTQSGYQATEINTFITEIYTNTSIYSISKNEEKVLAKINYTYDMNRKSGCMSVVILFILAVGALSFLH